MRLILICTAILALAACQKPQQPAANEAASTAEAGPHKGVDRSHRGEAMPQASFNGPDGKPTSLVKFKGMPVLVNLWATWCAPCVKELPTLNKQAEMGDQLRIIAISEDEGPQASVDAFLKKLNIAYLPAYHDPKMALSAALGPDTVLPTTIFYDPNGKEVWRYVGDLDWNGPEAAKLFAESADVISKS